MFVLLVACHIDDVHPAALLADASVCPAASEAGASLSRTAPPSDAFMVDDFERGPGLAPSQPNSCTVPVFNGLKPSSLGAQESCDWLGMNEKGCKDDYFCEGSAYAGICPAYLRAAEDPWRGEYSLRLWYQLLQNDAAFAGVMLDISNKQDSTVCQSGQAPVNLTGFEYLSLHVRPGDDEGNAEVALQDVNSTPANLVETAPKVALLAPTNKFIPPLMGTTLPRGQWTEVRIPICDLLKVNKDGLLSTLDPASITKVLIDFAKDRFRREGTDMPQMRWLDIDDVSFLACPYGGCASCK
jgi:hypothetical protein